MVRHPTAAPDAPTGIERWVAALQGARPVRVIFTDNRVVLVSAGGTESAPTLRVHRCFRGAPDAVAEAVARLYLTRSRGARKREMVRRLREFVDAQSDGPTEASRPPRTRPPAGAHHDLRVNLARVVAAQFTEPVSVSIGWSPRHARRTLARWHAVKDDRSCIVVNRLLDDVRTPPAVLDYLVFHEVLHEVLRERQHGNRRVYHHAEFRRREGAYPGFPAIGTEAELLAERLWRSHRRTRRKR